MLRVLRIRHGIAKRETAGLRKQSGRLFLRRADPVRGTVPGRLPGSGPGAVGEGGRQRAQSRHKAGYGRGNDGFRFLDFLGMEKEGDLAHDFPRIQ
jgi:hypothetical protein